MLVGSGDDVAVETCQTAVWDVASLKIRLSLFNYCDSTFHLIEMTILIMDIPRNCDGKMSTWKFYNFYSATVRITVGIFSVISALTIRLSGAHASCTASSEQQEKNEHMSWPPTILKPCRGLGFMYSKLIADAMGVFAKSLNAVLGVPRACSNRTFLKINAAKCCSLVIV